MGKNIKGIDEELKVKDRELMQVGSQVTILQGSHKGLTAKVLHMQSTNTSNPKSLHSQMGMDGKPQVQKIDFEAYVSLELTISGAQVMVKRKRLQLIDQI